MREDYARQGIRVDTAPPGQHVSVIERKIRLVKECCRAIISVLPCPLCRALFIALVLFVVSRINLLPVMGAKVSPHSWNHTSPREALTGRKMSYSRDLRVGFLDYVQLVEPVNMSTHNTLAPRTRRGVALLPLSNSSGAVKFLLLDTGAVVICSKFTVLPMPDLVINHLTALAAADKKTVTKDPLFQYHGRSISASINDPETQDHHPIGDSHSDATYPDLITDDKTLPTDHEDIINPIVNQDDNDHNIPPDMDLYDPLSAEDYQYRTLNDTPSKNTIDSLDAISQQHQLIGDGKERIGGEIVDQQQLGGEIGDQQQLGGEIGGGQQLENMRNRRKSICSENGVENPRNLSFRRYRWKSVATTSPCLTHYSYTEILLSQRLLGNAAT